MCHLSHAQRLHKDLEKNYNNLPASWAWAAYVKSYPVHLMIVMLLKFYLLSDWPVWETNYLISKEKLKHSYFLLFSG